MKRILLAGLIITATLLAGCSLGSLGAPAPTYTPLPTYTPFPTFTPPPTATATFLPSPTEAPQETPTSVDASTATPFPTPTPSQLQAVLAFGSNLREGPGTGFDPITSLDAGETLILLGRDLNGSWVFVQTSIGEQGWVAVRQLQGPVDVPRIPLAQGIPTPDQTQAAAATTAPGSGTATATSAPSSSGLSYEVNPGAAAQCGKVTVGMSGAFAVDSIGQEVKPFDTLSPEDEVGVLTFQLDRTQVPSFLDVTTQGNGTSGQCSDADKTCRSLTVTLCVGASADAPAGGTEYAKSILFRVGRQSYNQFFQETLGSLPTVFKVVAP